MNEGGIVIDFHFFDYLGFAGMKEIGDDDDGGGMTENTALTLDDKAYRRIDVGKDTYTAINEVGTLIKHGTGSDMVEAAGIEIFKDFGSIRIFGIDAIMTKLFRLGYVAAESEGTFIVKEGEDLTYYGSLEAGETFETLAAGMQPHLTEEINLFEGCGEIAFGGIEIYETVDIVIPLLLGAGDTDFLVVDVAIVPAAGIGDGDWCALTAVFNY